MIIFKIPQIFGVGSHAARTDRHDSQLSRRLEEARTARANHSVHRIVETEVDLALREVFFCHINIEKKN